MSNFSKVLIIAALLAGLAAAAAQASPPDPASIFGYGGSYSETHSSYLGIDPQDVTSDRMADLKLKEERGVEAVMVDQDGPASKAGLKDHDVILQFNGARVDSVAELKRMLRETPAGRTVTLGISRDGQPMNIPVKLGDRGNERTIVIDSDSMAIPPIPAIPPIEIPEIDIPEIRIGRLVSRYGLQVEDLTPQLGEFFGIKDRNGVLVRSVEHGSPAEKAGIKAGDVILRLGTEKITNHSDWRMATRNYRSGSVSVAVWRDHREQQLSITLPARGTPQSTLYAPQFHKSMEDLQKSMERMRSALDRAKMQEQISKAMADSQRKLQEELHKLGAQLGSDWY